jgi:hypothetical protein
MATQKGGPRRQSSLQELEDEVNVQIHGRPQRSDYAPNQVPGKRKKKKVRKFVNPPK